MVPVIQGFVQIQRCFINQLEVSFGNREDPDDSSDEEEDVIDGIRCQTAQNLNDDEYDLIVISRRSRFRAGSSFFIKIIYIYLIYIKLLNHVL